ncbi:MAG: 5-formyltetrahydrofolate cyclo-ligase [Eubacteriales bacterium]|nr:5-formyltetrahydrofolate cyclo-ligase [Eubacteriales bacterium]
MSSHKAEEKQALRRQIRQIRRSLDMGERAVMDQAVRRHLLSLPDFLEGAAKCRTVYCYVSHGNETDTQGILAALLADGMAVAVPRVEKDHMAFYLITGPDDLTGGYKGILEPKQGCPAADCKAAPVLVPGSAFSGRCGRLGLGGGFYDRFMAEEPDHLWIGLAYEFQICSRLPMEEHDRPVDFVITEKQVYRKDI